MVITKDKVLQWLEEHHHSRDWLAEKCRVARGTVNNWLVSPRPIPSKAVPIIQALMQADEERSKINTRLPQNLVLEFSREDFDQICKAAGKAGKGPTTWSEEQLRNLAFESLESVSDLLAAEDQALYKKTKKPAPADEAADEKPNGNENAS